LHCSHLLRLLCFLWPFSATNELATKGTESTESTSGFGWLEFQRLSAGHGRLCGTIGIVTDANQSPCRLHGRQPGIAARADQKTRKPADVKRQVDIIDEFSRFPIRRNLVQINEMRCIHKNIPFFAFLRLPLVERGFPTVYMHSAGKTVHLNQDYLSLRLTPPAGVRPPPATNLGRSAAQPRPTAMACLGTSCESSLPIPFPPLYHAHMVTLRRLSRETPSKLQRTLAPMTTAKRAVIVWSWRLRGEELIGRRGARPADSLVSWWRGFRVIGPRSSDLDVLSGAVNELR